MKRYALAAVVLLAAGCASDSEPTGERSSDPGFTPYVTTTTTLPPDLPAPDPDVCTDCTGPMFGEFEHDGEPIEGGAISPLVTKVYLPGADGYTFCMAGIRYLAFKSSGSQSGVTVSGVLDPNCPTGLDAVNR